MTYRGEVKGGVIVLEPGAQLAEGTVVSVHPMDAAAAQKNGDADELWRMGELAADTGIPDLSINHDHYLYGHPKVKDERNPDE